MSFIIKLEPSAFTDIQEAILYYEQQHLGLGSRFYQSVNLAIETLRVSPFYQVRYDNVRCYLVKPFPFLIHFIVDEVEKKVILIAVIHTSKNPKNWPQKVN